ncbi:MAG: zinc-dependent peptidase [Planctomycetia bacterium]|nr:zinc-dependent peptidase [Planctomycetia bacterium]
MFSWLRDRRRKRLLAEPFPPHWDAILRNNVQHYSRLSDPERAKLRDAIRVLIDEKGWEPARGFHVTEEMKLTIAGQAALMLIGMADHDYFARVPSIVVHPGEFRRPDPEDATVEDEVTDEIVDGLASYRGPVVVGWEQVKAEARDPDAGYSVVIHEFAHQLDFLDEYTDGTPPLPSKADEQRWAAVMSAAFERHRKALDRGRETFFSVQAGDSESEFFADTSEAFFCRPGDLVAEEPDVYEILAKFYGVDPKQWFAA